VSRRIVVLGSLNTDLVVALPRLPRPAETIIGGGLQTFAGGKGANQAVAAARLGGSVALVGRVGSDNFGEQLLAGLRADAVDTTGFQRDAEQPTGAALILVEDGGQNMIAVAPGANMRVGVDEVRLASERLESDGALVVQLEIPLPAVESAIHAALRAQVRVILNAAPVTNLPAALLRGVDVLVVNEREAAALFGAEVHGVDDAAEAARAAVVAGARAAVVTLGSAGAVLVAPGIAAEHIPAFRVDAVDTTAAGDAFVGALAAGLVANTDLPSACRRASAAGALAASRPGAQSSLPHADELDRFLAQQ
jgi:ribokinase